MKKFIVLSLLALSTMAAQAVVSINLSGNPTTGPQFFVGSNVVADNQVVRIGTLTGAAPENATFSQLEGLFAEFGRTTTGTNNASGANTGRIQRNNILGGDGATSPEPDSFFTGKQVYIWVYGGSEADPNSPQGLFGSATVFADQATAVSVSMGSFVTALGRFEGGTAASYSPAGGATATSYNLAQIPEPSALAFAALGLTICLGRRKK